MSEQEQTSPSQDAWTLVVEDGKKLFERERAAIQEEVEWLGELFMAAREMASSLRELADGWESRGQELVADGLYQAANGLDNAAVGLNYALREARTETSAD